MEAFLVSVTSLPELEEFSQLPLLEATGPARGFLVPPTLASGSNAVERFSLSLLCLTLSIPALCRILTHCRVLPQEAPETLIPLLRRHGHLPHSPIREPHKAEQGLARHRDSVIFVFPLPRFYPSNKQVGGKLFCVVLTLHDTAVLV